MSQEMQPGSQEVLRAAKAKYLENLRELVGYVHDMTAEDGKAIVEAASSDGYMPSDIQMGDVDRYIELITEYDAPFTMSADEFKARYGASTKE